MGSGLFVTDFHLPIVVSMIGHNLDAVLGAIGHGIPGENMEMSPIGFLCPA